MTGKVSRFLLGIQKRFLEKRCGLTEAEVQPLLDLGIITSESSKYWIKAEPVFSRRCSACHYEGRPLYFNPFGLLIRRKCPAWICPHALAQLSPVLYGLLDLPFDTKRTDSILFKHITCTDPGPGRGGLGNVIFRVTREKMPSFERLRFFLTLLLSRRDKRTIGKGRAVEEAAANGGPDPEEFMKALPIDERSLESFLASPVRVTRLRALEKFRDYRIIIRVVSSDACLAGHAQGDEFVIDPMGRIMPDGNGKGICLMAMNKPLYRVIVALERMAGSAEGDVDINSPWFDSHISCYGAGLPLGACGQIMMKLDYRKV